VQQVTVNGPAFTTYKGGAAKNSDAAFLTHAAKPVNQNNFLAEKAS
jgi:hypothetical protein